MAHPVDVHVGKKLRLRRNMLGMSQEAIAREVGVTFQQIQKYERGVNRMGASRLFEFSQVLEVSVGYFFEGLEQHKPANDDYTHEEGKTNSLKEAQMPEFEQEEFSKRETLELMRNYYRLRVPLRKRIADLVRAIADNDTIE